MNPFIVKILAGLFVFSLIKGKNTTPVIANPVSPTVSVPKPVGGPVKTGLKATGFKPVVAPSRVIGGPVKAVPKVGSVGVLSIGGFVAKKPTNTLNGVVNQRGGVVTVNRGMVVTPTVPISSVPTGVWKIPARLQVTG